MTRKLVIITAGDLAIQAAVALGRSRRGYLRVRRFHTSTATWGRPENITAADVLHIIRPLRRRERLPIRMYVSERR